MSITYYCGLKYFSIARAGNFGSIERRDASSRAHARRRFRHQNATREATNKNDELMKLNVTFAIRLDEMNARWSNS
jgi:hypothetical protein